MAAEAALRNTARTPNILQNDGLSPVAIAKNAANTSTSSTNSNNNNNNKSISSMKLQSLKVRKAELDRLLLEKNNLLQQLCRQEAQLIGCYPSDGTSVESGDVLGSTLRRKVGTSFKLPENLLNNGKEDEINKMLLARQIQQQISEASLKLSNDSSQTKVNLMSMTNHVTIHNLTDMHSIYFSRFVEPTSKTTKWLNKNCKASIKI